MNPNLVFYIEELIASWELEVIEFATKDDPYYNGVRQCIDDLKATLSNEEIDA